MMKIDISRNLYQKCSILCSKITPQYKLNSLVTMTTYWIPDLPNIKGFSDHLWRFILIFANGTSSA